MIDELIAHPPADARLLIMGRLPKLIKSLKVNPSPFRSRLVLAAKLFFDIYAESLKRSPASRRGGYSAQCRVAVAVLYYFCEVDDVIADYDPVRGFDDDAHAFNYCINRMKDLESAWHKRAIKALQ